MTVTRREVVAATVLGALGWGAYNVAADDEEQQETKTSSPESTRTHTDESPTQEQNQDESTTHTEANEQDGSESPATNAARLTLSAPDEVAMRPGETAEVPFRIRNESETALEQGEITLLFPEGLPNEFELYAQFTAGATWVETHPGNEVPALEWQAEEIGGFAPGDTLTPEMEFAAPQKAEASKETFTATLTYADTNSEQEAVTLFRTA